MQNLTPWIHKVQYYETDQMKIVHHSNYIRWFEEARIHLLDETGCSYEKLEADGIGIPVISVEAKFIKSVHFGETVKILTSIDKFDGIRLNVSYQIFRAGDDVLCCTGASGHCFLGEDGRPLSLKRKYPAYYEAFISLIREFS